MTNVLENFSKAYKEKQTYKNSKTLLNLINANKSAMSGNITPVLSQEDSICEINFKNNPASINNCIHTLTMARCGSVKIEGKKIKVKNNKLLESAYKKSHPKNKFIASNISTANSYNLMSSEEL